RLRHTVGRGAARARRGRADERAVARHAAAGPDGVRVPHAGVGLRGARRHRVARLARLDRAVAAHGRAGGDDGVVHAGGVAGVAVDQVAQLAADRRARGRAAGQGIAGLLARGLDLAVVAGAGAVAVVVGVAAGRADVAGAGRDRLAAVAAGAIGA